ncbi:MULTISPECIES: hypothetical protein [Rhizobium/Agrobacterium group]|uniref:Uncharacterized protein n=1 Tax=Rhizobium rhizogenes TaxID=359 RepID=A0A546XIL7_RHIRH|nr:MULTISPECIES: hypothetical protein [Rhizobium/Agrobacterium group]TRB00595.1 hypothetical protein EXN68_12950 [Rhizobium rhizogenes]
MSWPHHPKLHRRPTVAGEGPIGQSSQPHDKCDFYELGNKAVSAPDYQVRESAVERYRKAGLKGESRIDLRLSKDQWKSTLAP